MLDQAFHSAEARRVHKQLYARSNTKRFGAASANQEGEHASKAFHLPLGNSVSNVRG